jgi:hypothetical protein
VSVVVCWVLVGFVGCLVFGTTGGIGLFNPDAAPGQPGRCADRTERAARAPPLTQQRARDANRSHAPGRLLDNSVPLPHKKSLNRFCR